MDEEQGWVPASYLEPEDGSVESAVATTYKPGGEDLPLLCQWMCVLKEDWLWFRKWAKIVFQS